MKLPTETKRAIIRSFLNNPNQSQRTIADKFGVAITTVHNVLTEYFKEKRDAPGRT